MKKTIITFSLLFLGVLLLPAQFQFRFGSPYHDEPSKVIQTQNGTLLIVGQTDGFGSSGNALLMKVNPSGVITWVKDYSGVNKDKINDVIELPDGNLVMCGQTNSYGGGYTDAFLMKTDANGNLIWANTYGGLNYEVFWKVLADGSGGFFVHSDLDDPSGPDAATVLRTDSIGTVLWAKGTYNSGWTCSDMIRTSNGDIILAGGDNSYTTDIDIYRLSPSGSVLWSKEYRASPAGSGLVNSPRLAESTSGDIFLNYSYASSGTALTTADNCLMMLNGVTGNIISNKAYGGNYTDYSYAIINTTDGGAILLGTTNSAGNGAYDVSLMKINSVGVLQWAKAYGTAWDEAASGIFQLSAGGYVFSGQTISSGYAYDSIKIYLVKTDSLGNGLCNDVSWSPQTNTLSVVAGTPSPIVNIAIAKNPFTWPLNNRSMYSYSICVPIGVIEDDLSSEPIIYPNPFISTITLEIPEFSDSEIIIQNILGEIVHRERINNSNTKMDLDFLPRGIYLCDIVGHSKRSRQKIIKQ